MDPGTPHILPSQSWVLKPELGSASRTIHSGAFFRRLLMRERANGGIQGRRSALLLFLKEDVEPSVHIRWGKGPRVCLRTQGEKQKIKASETQASGPWGQWWNATASLRSRQVRAPDWAWLGREMLKRALPKPAGPTPGGQALDFESPSAPRVLGKGPPATPRAPLFPEYKVNPCPWILTCWLQHYLSTKGPFSGNEVGIQAWSPDSQKS